MDLYAVIFIFCNSVISFTFEAPLFQRLLPSPFLPFLSLLPCFLSWLNSRNGGEWHGSWWLEKSPSLFSYKIHFWLIYFNPLPGVLQSSRSTFPKTTQPFLLVLFPLGVFVSLLRFDVEKLECFILVANTNFGYLNRSHVCCTHYFLCKDYFTWNFTC